MENLIVKHNKILKYSFIVQEILGEYYEDLKAFFKKCIQTHKYEYKVFMSRRCFVLYQLFQFILAESGEDVDKSSRIIITDKGIVHYENALKEAGFILLVDDVLIHGRTLKCMYDKLKKLSPQAQVDISVYIRNSSDLCIDEELLNEIWFRFIEETSEWREFSDKLVYCIYAANMPYTAFVNSYYKKADQEELSVLKDKFSELKYYDVTNEFQRKYGLSVGVYFQKDMEKYPLLQNICRKCCIRIYYNDRINKLLMIPYVFLKDVRLQYLESLFDQFAELLPEFKDDLLVKSNISIDDEAAYKARLSTCVFSYIYGALSMHERGVDAKEWLDDRDTVQKSFHDNIAARLFGLSLERMKEIVSSSIMQDVFCVDAIQTWYGDNAIGAFDEAASLQQNLCAYFRMEGDEDEKRAKEKMEKLPGSTVEAILRLFKEQGDEDEIYACLVNAWDSGCTSFDWGVSEDGQYLVGLNTEGEQNFRQIIEKYPLYFRDVALLLGKIQGEVLVKGVGAQLQSEIHSKVERYCKKFSVPEEFEKYIFDNESDLEQFAVPDIYNSLIDDISEEHADKWVAFCCENF